MVPPAEIAATVLNSSGLTGVAVEASDALVEQGFTVDHWGNGEEMDHPAEASTVVRYGRGAAGAAQTLAAHVEGGAETTEDLTLDSGEVVVFLGADYTGIVSASASAATSSTVASSQPSTSTTSTTVPPPSKVTGMIPGDPPPGKSCG